MTKSKRKRKPGPKSFRSQSKLPRYASLETRIQKERNDQRSKSSMDGLRYGFKLMWREAPEEMRRCKVGEVGSFDKHNGHKGLCWGWPRECKLTNAQAKRIYWAVYEKKRLTVYQMKTVRKALAYAFQLTGGDRRLKNYASVNNVSELVKESALADSKVSVIPKRIPTVRDLKKAFDTEWTPESPWCFMEWLSGLICAYDCFLNGLRAVEDVTRLKKSRSHQADWKAGWQRTAFLGGRAKLSGPKKNTRKWDLYTTCFCPQEHQGPPPSFWVKIQKDGNPRHPEEVIWTTTCPLAALQLMWQLQDEPRRYGKWLGSGKFGSSNIGDPVKKAMQWFCAQGVCESEDAFDHNSGRKCFARLARALDLEYPAIFQVVQDLEEVWRENYDPDLPKSNWSPTKRDQSPDPSLCTEALRIFRRRVLKRGGAFLPRMSRSERLIYASIRLQHGQEEADKALFGDDDPLEVD